MSKRNNDSMTKNPIKAAKKISGLTGEQLAEKIGISASYLSRLGSKDRPVKTDLIDKLAEAVGMSSAEFYGVMAGESVPPERTANPGKARVAGILEPEQLPLLGDLNGIGDYLPSPPDHIDTIEGPQRLLGVPGAYALRMPGTSMEPRYHEGETLFVNPRTAKPGQYTVIQYVMETGEAVWQVARYERVAGNSRIFSRCNGADLTIPNDRIYAIHEIIATGNW